MENEENSSSKVMKQGSTYEEDGSIREEERKASESFDTISRKQIFILGGAIFGVICIIIFVVVVCIFSGKEKTVEETIPEWMTEEYTDFVFEYTNQEKEALRLAGYTGREIEEFEFLEKDANTLVEKAAEDRKKQYEKEILPYFNAASDEFKELWENSWLGQADLVYDQDTTQYAYYYEVMNVDYVKLPAKGHQLFIKFFLENGDAVFMTVTPERYLTLKDSGNIVIKVSYTQTADGKRIITDTKEITP